MLTIISNFSCFFLYSQIFCLSLITILEIISEIIHLHINTHVLSFPLVPDFFHSCLLVYKNLSD